MALDKNFYYEIQTKEQEWIELINKKLMNIYFFNAELVPFYNKKLDQLNIEYNSTKSKIIGQIIEEINYIIIKLKEFDEIYRAGKEIDINSLIPLFLTSKLNNETPTNDDIDIERLQIREQILRAIRDSYKELNAKEETPDYIYEDFPE